MILNILGLCLSNIKTLANIGLINFHDANNTVTSNPAGEIMAKYSISFVTMKLFLQVCIYMYNK